MTLAEVAAKVRKKSADRNGLCETLIGMVVADFEADPDFALRERVEALARHYEGHGPKRLTPQDHYTGTIARRIRETLEAKP